MIKICSQHFVALICSYYTENITNVSSYLFFFKRNAALCFYFGNHVLISNTSSAVVKLSGAVVNLKVIGDDSYTVLNKFTTQCKVYALVALN